MKSLWFYVLLLGLFLQIDLKKCESNVATKTEDGKLIKQFMDIHQEVMNKHLDDINEEVIKGEEKSIDKTVMNNDFDIKYDWSKHEPLPDEFIPALDNFSSPKKKVVEGNRSLKPDKEEKKYPDYDEIEIIEFPLLELVDKKIPIKPVDVNLQ